MKQIFLGFALLLAFPTWAETIILNGTSVNFSIREANYNEALDKLNVDVEVELVNKRLPSELEIAAVSEVVLTNLPKAKMIWLGYFLPEMPSNAGSYATDHRAPEHEGVKILDFMLFNTPYQELIE
jgi:hypothetical protein